MKCEPVVILLDLRLPKVDGLEVLQTVKSDPDLSSIPVVVLTTSAAEVDMIKAYNDISAMQVCHAGLGDCVVIGENVIPNECEES